MSSLIMQKNKVMFLCFCSLWELEPVAFLLSNSSLAQNSALYQQALFPRYCALICSPSSNDAQCGTNASCKSIQGTGLCTYDDAVDTSKATTVKYDPSIVV